MAANKIFFLEFPSLSTGVQPLAKEPDNSGYEIDDYQQLRDDVAIHRKLHDHNTQTKFYFSLICNIPMPALQV